MKFFANQFRWVYLHVEARHERPSQTKGNKCIVQASGKDAAVKGGLRTKPWMECVGWKNEVGRITIRARAQKGLSTGETAQKTFHGHDGLIKKYVKVNEMLDLQMKC
jgi:hypothetical protein